MCRRARNRAVIEKIAAVFESYWQQPDFEPYDRERSSRGAKRAGSSGEFAESCRDPARAVSRALLEQIELSRQRGIHRNLLVSATGTGKTVMAAVDYVGLERLPRARLLFVAHRAEILEQSRATFAHALRDGNFGELWVGGDGPELSTTSSRRSSR